MSNEIRKPIATLAAGLFICAVFCFATIGAKSFLERTCRIESGQSKTILLIALAIATPFFVIFTRWIRRTGIILGGILLAILVYSFLFRHLPVITGTAGRAELTDRRELRTVVTFIGKSRDFTRTTSTLTHYADGMQAAEAKEDTVFADGRISAHQRTTLSNTLNNNDYWKIVGILAGMGLSLAMICGPTAAGLYTWISGLAIPPKGRTFAHVD